MEDRERKLLKNREYMRKKRASNPEVEREKARSWRAKNREKCNEARKRYRKKNPELSKIENRKRYWANPEKWREYQKHSERKRAVKRNDLIGFILKKFRISCAMCGTVLTKQSVRMDHIMPLAMGGSDADSNKQLLCVTCNASKHASHPVDFARSLGKLI